MDATNEADSALTELIVTHSALYIARRYKEKMNGAHGRFVRAGQFQCVLGIEKVLRLGLKSSARSNLMDETTITVFVASLSNWCGIILLRVQLPSRLPISMQSRL